MKFVADLTAEIVRELLNFCPETGEFTQRVQTSKRVKVGQSPGTRDRRGYLRIYVQGHSRAAHRLAWLHYYGELPNLQIDHINGLKTDNRIANLRVATAAQNMANRGSNSLNTSGVKGVSWHKARRRWVAKCSHNGKRYDLGRFGSLEEAREAYNAAAERLHGEFVNLAA